MRKRVGGAGRRVIALYSFLASPSPSMEKLRNKFSNFFLFQRPEDVKIPFDHSLPLKPLYRFDAYKCIVEIFGHPYKALYRKCDEGTKSKVANHYQVAELNFDHVTEKIETSELKHEDLSSTGSHEARNVFVHPSGSCAQIMQIHSNDNQQHELR